MSKTLYEIPNLNFGCEAMKIKIMEINCIKETKTQIRFTSLIGEGYGLLISTDKAKIGLEIEVELDIPGILCQGQEIIETEGQRERIYIKNNKVHITGYIEQLEEDNLLTIRLGKSILLIEVEDKALYKRGQWIEIRTENLQLTDFIF